jgi:hypothetical protein
MADPTGNELLTVVGVQPNSQPAATTETFTLNQIGSIPSIFGAGTAVMEEQGNINSQVGNPLANPSSITNDNVLAVYTVPANSFDAAGVGIEITASGNLGADTQAKRCKVIWNPSAAVVGSAVATTAASFLLGDTGSTTNAGVAAGWLINSQVFKYGANGSNTQIGQMTGTIIGTTHGGMGVAAALTTNEAASVIMAVTGNATSSVGDISLYTFQTVGQNY